MEIHPMWNEYPVLKDKLQATLQTMEQAVSLKNKEVENAVLRLMHAGGKMLRPAYCLLFAEFGPKQDDKKAVALAAAVETLHTATLIHDDIVDQADFRRGTKTIQYEFGNDVAVYAGDYLFIICFKLLSNYASSLQSIQLNSSSMEQILNGELGQMTRRYDTSMPIEQYIENITGKTGELFALSCFVGAYESGTSQLFANKCRKIGEQIGIAFQIKDDILDYDQSASQIGKPVLEDVRQGVYSLPLLLTLQKAPNELLPLLHKKQEMSLDDAAHVWELVHHYQGVEAAQEIAESYTKQALRAIQKLPDNSKQTRQNLLKITQFLLERTS